MAVKPEFNIAVFRIFHQRVIEPARNAYIQYRVTPLQRVVLLLTVRGSVLVLDLGGPSSLEASLLELALARDNHDGGRHDEADRCADDY